MNKKQLDRRIELREKALELYDQGADYKVFQENKLQTSWYYTLKSDKKRFMLQLEELKALKDNAPTQEEEVVNITDTQSRISVLAGEIKRYHRVIQKASNSEKDIYIDRMNELIDERLELEEKLSRAFEKQTYTISNTDNTKYDEL